MAQSSGGDIIKYGLLAVGGYLLYNWWVSQPASPISSLPGTPLPPAPTGGGPILPPPPVINPGPTGGGGTVLPPQPTPPVNLSSQLQAAAGLSATATLNADQWSYYYQGLPGRTAIPGAIFQSLFFPNGRPADTSQNPQMTADQFVAALATKGLSGLDWPSFWQWLMGLFSGHPATPASPNASPQAGGYYQPAAGPAPPPSYSPAPPTPPIGPGGGSGLQPGLPYDPNPGFTVLDPNSPGRVTVGPIRDANGNFIGMAGLGVMMPRNYQPRRRRY